MKFRKIAAAALAWGISASGSLRKVRLSLDRFQGIVCAYGHNPSRCSFESLILWLLANRFNFISDADLQSILENRMPIQPRSVWLSFDDGYCRNLENVVPVLERYEIPGTFFVCPKAIETGWLWFDVARKYSGFLPGRNVRVLYEASNTKRERMIDGLFASHKIKPDRSTMTPDEVMSLSRSKLFSVQNHTNSHVIMDNCSEHERLAEIRAASLRITEWTGKNPRLLSYPHGRCRTSHADILKSANISLAFTCEPRFLDLAGSYDRLLIPRTNFINDGSLLENICHVFGIWQPLLCKIRRRLRLPTGFDAVAERAR